VRYGGQVRWVTERREYGAVLVTAIHVGPDRHGEVPPGEQCRCGWINLGVRE
jgi:hypothetical protein